LAGAARKRSCPENRTDGRHVYLLLTFNPHISGEISPGLLEAPMFWKPIHVSPQEAARLKARYQELGSLQAVADEENVHTAWLGQILLRHDRRIAGSGGGHASRSPASKPDGAW
jgi:hypothetical protein